MLSYYVCLRSEFRVVVSVMTKTMFGCSVRLYIHLFVDDSCLIYVIVSVWWCFCFVFRRLVYPMLPVSLFFVVLCTLCCQFLCFSSSCVPYVASFSVFHRLVYPMLPVSLDCPFLLLHRDSLTVIYVYSPHSILLMTMLKLT